MSQLQIEFLGRAVETIDLLHGASAKLSFPALSSCSPRRGPS
jgi:hypothetical protein